MVTMQAIREDLRQIRAPPQLYDLYISLYVHNNTQAALAYEWDFCNDHIKRLNKQLCEYFLKVFSNEKQGDEHE